MTKPKKPESATPTRVSAREKVRELYRDVLILDHQESSTKKPKTSREILLLMIQRLESILD